MTKNPSKTVGGTADLMKHWDSNKNHENPNDISIASKTPYFWHCKTCGYSWSSAPRSRVIANGKCPCCDSQKAIMPGFNDVLTLVPDLADYFDVEKNPDIDLSHQGPNSTLKVLWTCPECNREWQSAIYNRVIKVEGKWELKPCLHRIRTGNFPLISEVPEIMRFYDPLENDLDLNSTYSNSRKCIHLTCPQCKYKWSPLIADFMDGTRKCPAHELGRVVWPGFTDFLTKVPEARTIYDFEKNKNTDPTKLGVNSSELVWWRCQKCGREWQQIISHLIYRKDGEYTIRRCKCERTRTVASVPKLRRFWDQEKNEAKMEQTSVHLGDTTIWWLCEDCGYSWQTSPRNRLTCDDACPACGSGIKIAPGVNDAITRFPELKASCDFEKNKEEGIDVRALGRYSHKIVNWKCSVCGWRWKSSVNARLTQKSNGNLIVLECPNCFRLHNNYASKYPFLLNRYAKDLNEKPLSEYNSYESRDLKVWWRCDVCHEVYQSTIQSMIQSRDTKTQGCPYCSGCILRQGESVGDLFPDLVHELDPECGIDLFSEFPQSKHYAQWICSNDSTHRWSARIMQRTSGAGNCPICYPVHIIRGLNSVADIYPEYVSLWSEHNELKADQVLYASTRRFIWKCPKCKGEYKSDIKRVVTDSYESCPYCRGYKALPGYNSLKALYPEIATLWNEDNDRSPDEVLASSGRTALWNCPDCKGVYPKHIKDMVSNPNDCPFCNDRAVLPGFNSFKDRHPDLMKEWDPICNYALASPDAISDRHIFPVWWICEEGHHYSMAPRDRLEFQKRSREPCPYCKGRRIKKNHFV